MIELYVCYDSSGWLLDNKFNSLNQAVKHARATLDAGVKCKAVDGDKYTNSVLKVWTIN
jgi:hypothetical protein